VISGTLTIAHLRKEVLSLAAQSASRWSWTFDITAGPPGFQRHGNADTREEATAGVEREWRAWLAAAGLKEA
jgi:hypothetical protein